MLGEMQGLLARLRERPDDDSALDGLKKLLANGASAPDAAELAALASARKLHRDRGDAEVAARLCEFEISLTKDPARRAELYLEEAKVFHEDLLDADLAVAALEEALLLGADEAAKRYLDQIRLVRENWERIAEKYATEANAATDRQLKTSLCVSAAEVLGRNAPSSPGVEKQLRAALEADPHHRRALLHMERMLRRQARWPELPALLEARAEAAETPDERVHVLLRAAEVAEARLCDRALAAELHRRILAIDAGHPRALGFVADYCTEVEDWQSLVKFYEGALRSGRPGEPELGMLLQCGMIWWRKLANLDAAEEYFRRIKQAESGHPAALDFYREYHASRGEGQKVMQAIEAQMRAEPDAGRKIARAEELARAAEEQAHNPEKAIELWKGVLRTEPGRPSAREALRRLCEQTGKWNALRELLKEDLDALPADAADARIGILLKIAAIYRDRLKVDAMVLNTYGAILQIRPDHEGALSALEEKYEAMQRWNDLAQILGKRAEREADPKRKVELLRRVATVWVEKFSNPAQALKPLDQILEIDGSDADAIARLREIHEKRRNWKALLEVMRRETALRQGADRRALLAEMAKLAAERLNDPREAISLWNRVLMVDEGDAEALERLAALYEREKRFPALAEILRRQRAALGDDARALPLLEKLGGVLGDRLGARDAAIEVWRDALRIRPDHAKALRALRDIYADREDWEALEAIFAERQSWAELCETLSQAAERATDDARKVRLLERVAEVASDPKRLGRAEVAQKAWERVLAVEPDHVAAARALAPIYEKATSWARVLAMKESMLSAAKDDRAAELALLADIRALCEARLGSKGLAYQWCARAFALDPDDAALRGEVLRLGREASALEELASLLREHADRVKDADARADLMAELGDLLRKDLGRAADARACYEKVLERRPNDRAALEALEEILGAIDEPTALRDVLGRRAALETDIPRRIDVLLRVAYLEEERLEELDAAVGTYERIRELAPKRMATLHSLERLHHAREDWTALRSIYEAELELAPDAAARAQSHFQLGQLLEKRLGDVACAPAEGIEQYRRALEIDGAHRGATGALEAHLSAGGARGIVAARLLAPHYERAHNHAGLARALEAIVADETGAARAEVLRRLVAIYEEKRPDAAALYEASARLLETAPDDAQNRARLPDRAATAGKLEELAARLRVVAEKAEGEPAAVLWTELGSLQDERLLQPDEAEKAFRRVLAAQPHHTGAFEALRRILGALERFGDLRDLLLARAEAVVDAAERKDLLLQIAELCEDVLDDREGAIAARERVLGIDPAHLASYRALVRHYEKLGRFRELEDLLARQREVEPERDRVALDVRRAWLRAEKLEDAAGALDLADTVLAVEPAHPEVVGLLELLLSDHAVRGRVARMLVVPYEARRDFARLCDALRVQREDAGDTERFELTVRVAEIQENQLRDVVHAFATWREAIRMDPADERPRKALERLAGPFGRWKEIAQAWEDGFRAVPAGNVSLRAELGRRAAEVWDERLRDPAKAREAWKAVLEIDPDSPSIAAPAAKALERLYEAGGQWQDLAAVLRRQAAWLEDPAARLPLLLRVAQILEESLGDVGEAIATYREALEADPTALDALDQLERLFLAGEKWSDMADVLRRKLDLAGPDEKRDLRGRLALLHDEMLGDVGQAITVYLEILEADARDVEALQALTRLYERQERWADQLDALERRLKLATRPIDRVALLVDMAGLERKRLGNDQGALERTEAVLAIDARHAGARETVRAYLAHDALAGRAAAVLEPIYRAEGDHRRLAEIHQIQAKLAATPGERVVLLRKAAESLERGAGDARAAFDVTALAAREAVAEPSLTAVLGEIERLASALGLDAARLSLLRDVGPDVADGTVRDRVHLATADLASRLGDRATARDYYRRVLDSQPAQERALDALEALYEADADWESLLALCQQRAEIDSPETLTGGHPPGAQPDRRLAYLWKAGQICDRRLARPTEAIVSYEQMMEVEPGHAGATAELEGLYALPEIARWADLADLLEKRIARARDPREQTSLRFRLAQVCEQRLHEPGRALDMAGQVLKADPAHDGAVKIAEGRLDDPDHRFVAAEMLEPIYAARQDWARLVRTYETRLEGVADPAARRDLVARIARLHEDQLDDLEQALAWYGRAWREEPSDRRTRDQVVRVAGVLDKWPTAASLFQSFLDDRLEEDETTRDVARLLGGLYEERLHDPVRARDAYLRALRFDRGDVVVFEKLEACLARAARWPDLLDVYREMADANAEPRKRREHLVRAARVQEECLSDNDAAISTWREVLDAEPQDAAAMASLDRLFQATGRWSDLVELLLRQLEAPPGTTMGGHPPAEPGAQVGVRHRLGSLYEERLGDRTAAVDAYEEVLKSRPDHADARRALERLMADPAQRLRAARILQPLYRAAGEFAMLVEADRAELDLTEDRERRVALLREIAQCQEQRLRRLDEAYETLARAFAEDHANNEVFADLDRVAGLIGRHDDLARRIEQSLDGIYDVDLHGEMCARLARIHERLRDRGRAIDAWRRRLAMVENDETALDNLDRLLTADGRYEDLVEVLHRKVEGTPDASARRELLRRIADVQENVLVRAEPAIETWREVLSLDENDRDALDALERLFLGMERWADLVGIYQRKLELAGDAAARRRLRVAIAGLYEDRIGDSFEAIAAWRALIEAAPDDATALAALDRLYAREQNWTELVGVIDAEAKLADGAARAALEFRAARVLEKDLSDVETALGRYAAILGRSPAHGDARQAVEGLLEDTSHREAAASVLDGLYRRLGDHGALVSLLELRAQDAADPAARARLYRESASVREERLRDPTGAFAALEKALGEDAADEEALGGLERLTLANGAWADLARFYEKRLDGVFDPELLRRYQMRLASLCEEALGDDDRAAHWYRRAIETGADEAQVLGALDRICERGGKFSDLAEVLEREAQVAADPVDQAGFLARLGLVRELEVRDLEGALGAYRDTLDRDAANASALEGLERIATSERLRAAALDVLEPAYERAGDACKRVEMTSLRLTLARDAGERVGLLRRMAEIHEKDLHDRVSALEALLRALEADATDAQVAGEIERLAGETGTFPGVCARVDALLDGAPGRAAARDLGLRCGRWWRDRAGDAARAEARLRKVVAADPDCAPALVELAELYRKAGRVADLAATLRRRADLAMDFSERKQLLSEAATVLGQAGDLEGAVAGWRAVLDVDENDAAALAALTELFDLMGRVDDLCDALARRARLASGKDAVPLLLRAGELLLSRLRDNDRAGDAYRDVLDHDPANATALAALERVYRERGDHASVSEILMRQLSHAEGGARVEVLRKLAAAAEEQSDFETAIDYGRQALEARPDDAAMRDRLLGWYERTGKWLELCEALEKLAEDLRAAADAGELDLWVRVARLREEKLDDLDGAARALERVLERDRAHAGALTGRARLFERAGEWQKAVEALECAIAVARSPAEVAEVRFRMGRVRAEGLGDDAGATAEFDRALVADPRHALALEEVERRARDRGDDARLCEVLALRKDAEADPKARLDLCREIGRLCVERLGKPADAVPHLEEAARLAPDDARVWATLGDLYFAAGRTPDAEVAYLRVAPQGGKGRKTKETAHVLARLGAIAEKRGDTAAAIAFYEEANKIDSTHAPTLGALGRLAFAAAEWEKARKAYRSILLGNLEEAAGLPKGEVYFQLGQIHARMGETAKALNMYERGLEADPGAERFKRAIEELKK